MERLPLAWDFFKNIKLNNQGQIKYKQTIFSSVVLYLKGFK
jgi:hypothetical protein